MADLTHSLAAPAAKTQRPVRPFPWRTVLTYAVLLLGTLLALGPFLWMLSASFMRASEIAAGQLFPAQLQFSNYPEAWQLANLSQFMWNSVRITAITVTGELLFCIPAAYAFARMNFYGRNILFGIMLSTMMIPSIATLIPNYLSVVWLSRLSESVCGEACRWLDNWPALTIPFMASAFSIFLLRQFFAQIPTEFWDAARIDGAGHRRFLWSVVLPLSKAPVLTVAMFGFIGSWNSLMWPMLVVQTDTWRPISFGLQKFVNADAPNELHLQMAAAVLMIVPMLVLYFFTQKQFTEGIASSGVKG
ncbi:MAG TPA: carbohydrate ABC transporter permease [Phototrophicaceae bacterium]|nr:carbohydrate ABC transporter permease [Phototrophicaceae bacterium]